jgi:hypothetical protein
MREYMIGRCWAASVQNLHTSGMECHHLGRIFAQICLITEIIMDKAPSIPVRNKLQSITRSTGMKPCRKPANIGSTDPVIPSVIRTTQETLCPVGSPVMDNGSMVIKRRRKRVTELRQDNLVHTMFLPCSTHRHVPAQRRTSPGAPPSAGGSRTAGTSLAPRARRPRGAQPPLRRPPAGSSAPPDLPVPW